MEYTYIDMSTYPRRKHFDYFRSLAYPYVGMTVNLWYYTTSESEPNAKAREISKALGLGGVQIPCDDGSIWLTRGSPWCQSLTDANDEQIKRRYLNITASYNTIY